MTADEARKLAEDVRRFTDECGFNRSETNELHGLIGRARNAGLKEGRAMEANRERRLIAQRIAEANGIAYAARYLRSYLTKETPEDAAKRLEKLAREVASGNR